MCVSLQRRAIQNFKMCVSLQRRAQKCMNLAHDVRGNPRHTKITILPQFRTSDQHEVTRGLRGRTQICVSPQFWTSDEHETTKGLRGPLQNLRFTTVLDVRRPRSDERVASPTCKLRISPQFWTSDEHEVTRGLRPRSKKFAFHHSFGRPMSTKWREGCEGHVQN